VFQQAEKARRIATRHDKAAESFPAFIDTASIGLWLGYLST